MAFSTRCDRKRDSPGFLRKGLCALAAGTVLYGCADVTAPGARSVDIPAPTAAEVRKRAVNEKPDSVVYLPLGEDVLQPRTMSGDPLPSDRVGPLELRGETLGGALQLILADYDIPLAFESEEGLTRTVTVTNLHGPLNKIVEHVCGLADLYCAYEGGLLTVKKTQTFTVSIPPVTTGDSDIIDSVATGLAAISGTQPIVDKGTRTLIYTTSHRTAEMAERYFQRMRSNTALIVFEIYIWEVSLNAQNSTGIDWEKITSFGSKFKTGISISGSASADLTPISIGLPTTGSVNFGTDDVFQFISDYGAVKTISQPQIAVLSGAKASLRVADTVNYVSSLERTVDNGEVSVSTQTDSVDTGFTMGITSAWDNATIYGTIDINLQEFRGFQDFDADGTTLQLPETTERELKTQVRIRPGDSLLIAGLVRENDSFGSNGPGFMKPIIATSRDVAARNVELVFLLRPRVVVYTSKETGVPAASPTIRTGPLAGVYKAGSGVGALTMSTSPTSAPEPEEAHSIAARLDAIAPAAGAMPPSSAFAPPSFGTGEEEADHEEEPAGESVPEIESAPPVVLPVNLLSAPSAPRADVSAPESRPAVEVTSVSESLPSTRSLVPDPVESSASDAPKHDYAPEYKKYYPEVNDSNPYLRKITGP